MPKLVGITCVIVALACGGKPAPQAPAARETPRLEGVYPVLALIPAHASYAIVARRAADAAFALREIVTPLGMMGSSMSAVELDAQLRASLGASPLSETDLADIGLDPDASAALFSTGVFGTVVYRIADDARLAAFLERQRPARDVTLREVDGAELATWQPEPGYALAYARLDDWFALHLSDPRLEPSPTAWLESMRAAQRDGGLAGTDDLEGAAATARARLGGDDPDPDVLGLARTARIAAAVGPARSEQSACWRQLAQRAPQAALGVDIAPGAARGVVVIALAEPLAADAAAHQPAAPPPGYAAYVDQAGLWVDLGVDFAWLDGLVRATCPMLGSVRSPLDPRLADGIRGVHAAIEALSLEQLEARGAAWLSLEHRRTVDRMLDQIPGFMKRSVTVRGERLRAVDAMGMFPRVTYRLADDHMLMAVGRGVIETVLGTGDPPPRPVLFGVGVRPPRLRDMEGILRTLFEQVRPGGARAAARAVAAALRRYQEAGLSIYVTADSAVLDAHMRLSPAH